jgi:hypothetical protein
MRESSHMTKTLTKLLIETNADKGPKYHGYDSFYEHWLADRTVAGREIKSLLEIGLMRGQSAKVWVDYFPNAQIYMMDDFSQGDHLDEVITSDYILVQGNSTDVHAWLNVPMNLDVIIDDGSHLPNDQINTFLWGFHHLAPGGLYFIEDTYINFDPAFSSQDIIYTWLQSMIVAQTATKLEPVPWGDFYKVRDKLPWPISDIYAYHLYRSVIMLEKAL